MKTVWPSKRKDRLQMAHIARGCLWYKSLFIN